MKTFYILITLILLLSCSGKKTKELEKRIIELENINHHLIDSLGKFEEQKIKSTDLIFLPYNQKIRIKEKQKFRAFLYEAQKYNSYKIFRIYDADEHFKDYSKKELIYDNYTDSYFDFDFEPKSKKDSLVSFILEFELNGIRLEVPRTMEIDIID